MAVENKLPCSPRSRPLAWRLVDCFRADWAPHRRSHAGCLLEAYPSGQIFSAMEAEGWLKGASAAEGWLKSAC